MLICKRIYRNDIRLSNPTDTHNSFMCTVFGETGGDSLFILTHNFIRNAKDRKFQI